MHERISLQSENVSLESLRVQSEMISLESFNPSQAFSALTDRIPGYVSAVKTFFTNILDPVHAPIALVDGVSSAKALQNMKYMDIRAYQVFVPTGLRSTYLQYLTALKAAELVAEKLIPETLNPLSVFLSLALSEPDRLQSLRGMSIPNFRIHDIDRPKQAIGNCFDRNGTVARVPLGQALSRLSDWPEVVHEINELNTRFNRTSRQDVLRLVGEVTELLDRLVDRVTTEPETYKLSGANLDLMSKLCYNVAREIEFYSLFAYNLHVLTIAIVDTGKLMENKFVENAA